MKFTRREVIKAIETENLKSGHIIDYSDLNNPKCAVCVVGAILRVKGFTNTKVDKLGDGLRTVGTLVNEWSDASRTPKQYVVDSQWLAHEEDTMGRPLHAISIMYEVYSKVYRTDRAVKNNLIKWVEENIPAEFNQKVTF